MDNSSTPKNGRFDGTALVVNVWNESVRFEISTVSGSPPVVYSLPVGGVAEIGAGYAVRLQPPGRDVQPSIIERITNGRVKPAYDPQAQAILRRAAMTAAAPSPASPPAAAPSTGRRKES